MSVRRFGWCIALAMLSGATALPPAVTASGVAQAPAQTLELQFDEGRRMLVEQLEYTLARGVFDRVITAILADTTVQKPELLAQAYDLRAQARYALGDQLGAEQDLVALLRVSPGYKLGASVSPRVVVIFDAKRRQTVGQVSVSLTPEGDAQIDGRPYPLRPDPQVIDLLAGEHQIIASKPGYESVTQKFTVSAGETTALPILLERTSATLAITTVPEDVEVIFDGQRRGVTRRGDPGTSAPLVLADLTVGEHRLQLRRPCYVTVERMITIERPSDLKAGPIRLSPAVANVKVESSQAGAAVLLDGVVKGQAPLMLSDLCEGAHVVEVRASNGRFVDRREWKAGDTATLTATLRSAFPMVAVTTVPGRNPEMLRAEVERALATTRNLLVYAPTATELQTVQGDLAALPAGWLATDPAPGAAPRTPRDVSREFGRTLATKLDAQGVAVISVGADPSVARVAILASGSGEPDVLLLSLTDSAARARVLEGLAVPLPPLLFPSIESAVVDLAGVRGAVVIQATGVGAKAGLAAGDTIVGAGDGPVASVAELRARIAAVRPPATELSLDVKASTGTARKVTVAVAMVPDTTQLRDPAPLSNLALVELQRALATASSPADRSAVLLNLAIIHLRLSNWTEAEAALAQVRLPEGRGVSAGTIAYLRGYCLEELGRIAEAQAAFTTAAAATEARLWNDGPLVAPLAQQKLRR